jgi:hypothetical protein
MVEWVSCSIWDAAKRIMLMPEFVASLSIDRISGSVKKDNGLKILMKTKMQDLVLM